jgi:ribosomal protein L40E
MGETLQQILLVVGILGASAVITNLFARAMYITCSKCGTLNARRRTACRNCGEHLRPGQSPD